jgi:hypothetical protein
MRNIQPSGFNQTSGQRCTTTAHRRHADRYSYPSSRTRLGELRFLMQGTNRLNRGQPSK